MQDYVYTQLYRKDIVGIMCIVVIALHIQESVYNSIYIYIVCFEIDAEPHPRPFETLTTVYRDHPKHNV